MNTTKTTSNLSSLKTANYCADGCGSLAKEGSSYLPGHDATLDSMLQRYVDGTLAKLPELVVKNLAAKVGKPLPAPRFQIVELTVKVRVRVAADDASPVTAATSLLHKRLKVKAIVVADVRATRPSTKEAKKN